MWSYWRRLKTMMTIGCCLHTKVGTRQVADKLTKQSDAYKLFINEHLTGLFCRLWCVELCGMINIYSFVYIYWSSGSFGDNLVRSSIIIFSIMCRFEDLIGSLIERSSVRNQRQQWNVMPSTLVPAGSGGLQSTFMVGYLVSGLFNSGLSSLKW